MLLALFEFCGMACSKMSTKSSRTTKPVKRPAHRPTKYTPETVAEITKAIREGCSQEDAALLAGINRATFYEWVNTKPDFAEAVQKAHADFKRANVAAIRAAGMKAKDGEVKGSWQANAWLLERKHPEEFGLSISVRVSVDDLKLLKKHGIKASEAWQLLMEQLATQEADKA